MKSCEGCAYLNAVYYKGPICKAGTSGPYTHELSGREYWRVMYLRDARQEGGLCGPERGLYKPRLWERIKRYFTAKRKEK